MGKIYLLGFVFILIFSACSTPQYSPPSASNARLNQAQKNINQAIYREKNNLSNKEIEQKVKPIMSSLQPAVKILCGYVNERKGCNTMWNLKFSDSGAYTAFASENNIVIIDYEVAKISIFDDEIAFVLAHEISHHLLNHINETKDSMLLTNIGNSILSYTLRKAVLDSANDFCYSIKDCYKEAEKIEYGMIMADVISGEFSSALYYKFSRGQESEADLLAAYILSLSGYSLIRARESQVYLASQSGRRTSFLDSHPQGADRLAAYDAVIDEVLSNVNRLPRKQN